MINEETLWELNRKNPRLVLAYETTRLHCQEVDFTISKTGLIWLKLPDEQSLPSPLQQAKRVGFLLQTTGKSGLSGNALVIRRGKRIGLAPYRLRSLTDQEGYISTFQGWVPEPMSSPQRPFRFWLRAVRCKSLLLSAFSVLIGSLFALVGGRFSPYFFSYRSVAGCWPTRQPTSSVIIMII